MNQVISKRLSDNLYVLKALSIVSVVTAHSTFLDCNNRFIGALLGNFSCAGVCIFFVLSGYFFCVPNESFLQFFRKKTLRICLPWVIAASITYSLRFLKSGFYINIPEYIKYLIGYGSLYYYLTMLLVLYLIYWIIGNNKIAVYISIVLSLLSVILTAYEIIDVYPYLNPLNWCVFFAAGILLRSYKLEIIPKRLNVIVSIIFGVILIFFAFLGVKGEYYWFPFSLLNETMHIIFLYCVSCLISGFLRGLLKQLGKLTFPIFLYHMPIITHLFNSSTVEMLFLKIILTVCICFFVFFLIKKLISRFTKLRIIAIMLGIKIDF